LATRLSPQGGREHKLRGAYAEWFVAGQVQIAGGSKVIVARHEVRVDCVGLLVHDLTTYHIGGLAVHSGLIRPTRRFALNIEAGNFFLDDQLWFVILGANPDGTFSDTAYLIPRRKSRISLGRRRTPGANSTTRPRFRRTISPRSGGRTPFRRKTSGRRSSNGCAGQSPKERIFEPRKRVAQEARRPMSGGP
jgi:hypothetical protein